MEKARCNTELYSNLRGPLNNVKPSNFRGSHHFSHPNCYNLLCVSELRCTKLFVNYAVTKLSKFTAVPSVGRTNEVTGDTLELVDFLATAVWALLHIVLCILISAIHATVAVMVY